MTPGINYSHRLADGINLAAPSLSEAIEKALPPASADEVARVTPEPDSIVSSLRFALLPIGASSTVALVKFTAPKSASGSTVPSLGAYRLEI
jgi:hypothetical protein